MKSRFGRLLAMALCAAVMIGLVACGSKSPEETGEPGQKAGRYVESQLEASGYSNAGAIAAHGNDLYIAANKEGADTISILRYRDGNIEELPYSLDPKYSVMGMDIDAEGNPVLLCAEIDTSATGNGSGVIDSSDEVQQTVESGQSVTAGDSDPEDTTGQSSVIIGDGQGNTGGNITTYILKPRGDTFQPIGEALPKDTMYQSLFALDNGGYLTGGISGILLLDEQGKVKSTFGSFAAQMAVSGNNVYTVEYSQSGEQNLVRYNADNGQKVSETPLPVSSNATSTGQLALATSGKGDIYLADSNGIFRLNEGGSKYEQLVDGSTTILGDASRYMMGAAIIDNGSIYVLSPSMNEAGGLGIYRYAWSDDAQVVDQTEITVVSVFDFPALSAAVNAYQRAHQDVKVNYRSYLDPQPLSALDYMSADEIQNLQVRIDDAVRAINTEMLSGNSPDVLILDGMPIQSYIDKGVLDDLSDWADSRINEGTWVSSITGAYRDGDALPCMPTLFSVPVYWGEASQTEKIKSLNDLSALSESLGGGQYLFDLLNERSLLTLLYPICAPDWVNGDGTIDFTSDNFKAFLEQIKEIQGSIPILNGEGNLTEKNFIEQKTALYQQWLSSDFSVGQGIALASYNGRTPGFAPLPGQSDKNVFVPGQIVAVSRDSQQKELAYDFLDMLLSEQVMKNAVMEGNSGYPIVASVLEPMISPPADGQGILGGMVIGDIQLEIKPLDEATSQKLKALIDSLDTASSVDYTLLNMIAEESLPYLRGEKALEATVESLNARAKAYLAE